MRHNLYICQDIHYEIIKDDILKNIPAPDLQQETTQYNFFKVAVRQLLSAKPLPENTLTTFRNAMV